MTDTDKDADDLFAQTFYLQRNIRYHMRRAAFFMRWSRLTSFVGVFAGSAAAAAFLAKLPLSVSVGLAVFVAFMSAIELVVGTGQLAWRHFDLRKRYLELEERLEQLDSPSQKEIRETWTAIRRIEADEPPTMSALEMMARNEVICSLYQQDELHEHYIPVPWWQRITAHWIDWDMSQAEPRPKPQPA